MLVEEFLERSAEQFPEKIALVCGNRRLCYREIDHRSNQLANCLIAKGVQRGDRVAVYLDNSVATIIALFGILKSGAAFVVVNPSTKTDKLLYILNNCRAAVVVTSGFGMTRLNDSWGKAPYLRLVIVTDAQPKVYATWDIADACLVTFETVFLDYPAERPTKRCIDIDLAALIYTSGSTGKPKGVMMTHLNIVSAATSITTYLENTSKDVIINVLPLAFDYGLYQLLMAFRMGATLVLERSFLYPTATLETMVREKVTGLPLARIIRESGIRHSV